MQQNKLPKKNKSLIEFFPGVNVRLNALCVNPVTHFQHAHLNAKIQSVSQPQPFTGRAGEKMDGLMELYQVQMIYGVNVFEDLS